MPPKQKVAPGRAAARLVRWMRRKKKKTSAAQLGARLGVSRVQIHAYIAGRKRPNLDHAVELERITGIPARLWSDAA